MKHAHHDHDTPLKRLVTLLRPESGDIAVIAMFSIVVGMVSLATPVTVEALVNSVAFGRYLQPLVVLAIMLFTFLAFAAVLKGLQTYVAEIIQRRIFVRVVADLAHRLPKARVDAFDGQHGPELLNRFFEVVTVQKSAAFLVLDGIAIVITSLIGMVVLAFYHPYLLGFDLVLLAAVAFTVFVLGRGAVKTAIEESYKKYAVASWLEQLAHFPVAFKLQGGMTQAVTVADRLSVEYLEARRRHFRVLMGQIAFTLGLQALAGTALLGIGGFLVINGQLTLGQLVASELIVAVIVGSFAKLGKHMESYYDLLAATDKLGHLFDLPTERNGGVPAPTNASGALLRLHRITLPHDTTVACLKDHTLTIRSGERIAITGPAGCGKSGLLEVLYGLRDPTAGYVEYDDVDLRAVDLDSLREQVALVRGVDVFEGSVAENVHMHRAGVTHGDVRRALEAVGLWKEVMRLPDGIDTQLTTLGAPLSDSQALRLVLARAIVTSPRLLLIDSLLDQLPDRVWRESVRAAAGEPGKRTLLVVTGRTSLLDEFDRTISLGSPDGDEGEHGPGDEEDLEYGLRSGFRVAMGS